MAVVAVLVTVGKLEPELAFETGVPFGVTAQPRLAKHHCIIKKLHLRFMARPRGGRTCQFFAPHRAQPISHAGDKAK